MEITVNLDNNNKHAIASSYPRAGNPLRTVNSVGYLIWMALVVIHWLKRGFVKIALEEKTSCCLLHKVTCYSPKELIAHKAQNSRIL